MSDLLVLECWGEKKTYNEWSKDSRCPSVKGSVIRKRVKRGWDAMKAITTSTKSLKKIQEVPAKESEGGLVVSPKPPHIRTKALSNSPLPNPEDLINEGYKKTFTVLWEGPVTDVIYGTYSQGGIREYEEKGWNVDSFQDLGRNRYLCVFSRFNEVSEKDRVIKRTTEREWQLVREKIEREETDVMSPLDALLCQTLPRRIQISRSGITIKRKETDLSDY